MMWATLFCIYRSAEKKDYSMSSHPVADTIASQLGVALCMIGASMLVAREDSLTFKVGRGAANKITHMRVTLTADDTYTVTGYQYRKLEMKKVIESYGVYADSLRRIIGAMTHFATTL